jgi:two-component sensor histidine kinase
LDDRITELAHELRTPLTGVLGAIDLVTDSPVPLDETEIEELLSVARSEANHLRSIIDGVVQRTRLDAGTLAVEQMPVSVVELVEETLARFPGVSDRTSVIGDTTLAASTDRSLAQQILTNLIQNVSRYAPSGPVTVSLERDGSSVAITVTDTGPGLPGGEIPSSKGLGVGLTTSMRLAETLGGSLAPATPAEGRGASFVLELPASEAQIPTTATFDNPAVPPPRARLLQEVADLLVGTSVNRILTGVGKLGREMLGASIIRVYVREHDKLVWLVAEGDREVFELDEDAGHVLSQPNGSVVRLEPGTRPWLDDLIADHLVATTMRSTDDGLEGFLLVGWADTVKPAFADGVLPALAALALVGVDRRSLGAELEFERRVRAEVMDSLPIAISVFAGDPPRLIGWNRAEREMLALEDDRDRPEPLAATQSKFEVRFDDGTPLTEENSPVVETIRTGRSTGPFYLRLFRSDGVEIVTRTYCAPVRDGKGAVIGAVVTSERVGD